jgi:hypothetical protein
MSPGIPFWDGLITNVVYILFPNKRANLASTAGGGRHLSVTNGFLSTAAACAPGAEEQASTPKPVPDDNALMQRLQEGDEAALGVLLDRYASLVFGIGFKVLRDREEADLVGGRCMASPVCRS